MPRPVATSRSPEIAAYVAAQPEPARSRLDALVAAVREAAPDATERMSYAMPTWHQRENLVHLAGHAKHVGLYPGPAAITAFAADLRAFKTSKGAVQIAHDQELPLELVRRITRWRVEQAAGAQEPRASRAQKALSRIAARQRRK